MRLRDQIQEASAADDYTPATDLVFSMLALTLLLLALFGTKTTINTNDMSGRINFLTAQGQSQDQKILRIREELNQKDNELYKLRKKLALLTDSTSVETIADLNNQIATLKQYYKEKRTQYEKIMDELSDAQRRSIAEIQFAPITQKFFGAFRQPDGRISDGVVDQIKKNLRSKQFDIEKYDLNEVFIRVESALHTGKQEQSILDSETKETFETGAAILKALWATSLPPACVTIEPVGKVRSSTLVDQLAAPGAGALAETWTKSSQAITSADAVRRYKNFQNNDNRIIIYIRRTDPSPCRSDLLAQSIERLR